MGEVLRQFEYKTEAFGSQIVKVGRFYASSKTCNDCGRINKELTLADRAWTCQGCGTIQQRDWNAAKNIEQEALRLLAA
jgi:putative transposase